MTQGAEESWESGLGSREFGRATRLQNLALAPVEAKHVKMLREQSGVEYIHAFTAQRDRFGCL